MRTIAEIKKDLMQTLIEEIGKHTYFLHDADKLDRTVGNALAEASGRRPVSEYLVQVGVPRGEPIRELKIGAYTFRDRVMDAEDTKRILKEEKESNQDIGFGTSGKMRPK